MTKRFFITTPIYYVNDAPHIGHAYTTVAADVLARWHKLNGHTVFFLTGTDEHGAKIEEAAAAQGVTPQELCDVNSRRFRDAWQNLAIGYDRFIRTTDPDHVRGVTVLLEKLHAAGHIYRGRYEGLYCVQCEKFMAAGDLNPEGCCPDHKTKPRPHSEDNWFFRLSSFQGRLLEAIESGELEILPVERRNEIIGKLKVGLEDISISRAAINWGIPLPFDKTQTIYVWVDALINYATGAGYPDGPMFDKTWPADVHMMAKDILWFHTIIWPALLLGAGLPLPKRVVSHGFFTIGGEKMSKTLGNVIRPDDLIAKFGAEAARYLLLALVPFGTDGDISWPALIEKYNTDLANNIGNLAARTATMVEKYCAGTAPKPTTAERFSVAGELAPSGPYLTGTDFSKAVEHIQRAVDRANRYIESQAPWKMAKAQDPRVADVLHDLLAAIGLIAVYLYPFMPQTALKLWSNTGHTALLESTARQILTSGADTETLCAPQIGSMVTKEILFPRLETK